MTSVDLTGKRRRVENAATKLSKPFKSPLRRPAQTPEKNNEATATSKKEEGEEEKKEDTRNPPETTSLRTSGFPSSTTTATPTPTTSPRATISQSRKRKQNNLNISLTPTKSPPADPIVADLQKQQRMLQSRLAALRSDLDTAQQALRIETSNRDVELEALIAKWRAVSQDAAEEVFAGAQERVARMGGMAAWREQTKGNNSRWEEEEMQTYFGSVNAQATDVDENELESRKEEMLDELGVSRKDGTGRKEEEKSEENEEFTVDMMLKTLNIDPQMIGFDIAGQRWIKD